MPTNAPTTTIGWIVERLEVHPTEDGLSMVVDSVAWRVNAHGVTDGNDYFSTDYGTTKIDAPDVAEFVPYDQLTPEIVLGWVKNHLGEVTVASIESKLTNQINEQANPSVIVPPLPWE